MAQKPDTIQCWGVGLVSAGVGGVVGGSADTGLAGVLDSAGKVVIAVSGFSR